MRNIIVNTSVDDISSSLKCSFKPSTKRDAERMVGVLWNNLRYESKNGKRIAVRRLLISKIKSLYKASEIF